MLTVLLRKTHRAFVLAAVVLATTAHALSPPPGICAGTDAVVGTVNGIVEAGARVFALTSQNGDHWDGGGIYISCSGGDEWYKHPDITDGGVSITADPNDANTIYAGIGGGSVHISRDAGDTWLSSRPHATGNISVSALSAVTGGKIFAGMMNGELLRSDNYGSTWQSIPALLPAEFIHSILVDPADSNRILVAVGDAGVYQSLDGGQNFQQGRFVGGIMPPAFWPVRDIAFMPADASKVLAGSSAGLFQSVDGGYEFSGLPGVNDVVDISFGRRDASSMFVVSEFAGLQRSTNDGLSFVLLAPELPRSTDWFRSALQLESGRLLMGTTFEGIYKSDDDGETWQIAGAQLPDLPPPVTPPPVDVTAKLNLRIEDLNRSTAVELGTKAKFRVTVRNDGSEVSTNTFVHFNWVMPDTNSASSLAFTLSSSVGTCIVERNSDVGCSVGTLAVGQSATINFDGTVSTSFIGEHRISVTARNAQGSVVVAGDRVASKKSIACYGDCGGKSSGGGSAGLLLLVALMMLIASNRVYVIQTT